MSGDSWWTSNHPNLHQLCFSLYLCSLSIHSTLWPLNCPFFFLRVTVGLIAKWGVCEYTGHTTNTGVSSHRRRPLEGNTNRTQNVTRKISYLQPRPTFNTFSLSLFLESVFSHCSAALSDHALQSMMKTAAAFPTNHFPAGLSSFCAEHRSDPRM